MLNDTLKELIGTSISVIAHSLAHPVGGILKVVGEDYILLMPSTGDASSVIIPTKNIASIMFKRNNGGNNNEKNETFKR